MRKSGAKIIAAVVVLIVSSHAKGMDGGKYIGANVEAGFNGNYGLIGGEIVKMVSDLVELHAGVGADMAILGGAGFRIYSPGKECFLLKHCEDKFFFGSTLTHGRTSSVSVVDEDNNERKYSIPEADFVHLGIGTATVFFKHFNSMFNIGYKLALKKGEAEQLSGATDTNEPKHLQNYLNSGIQASFALGFLF